VRTGFGGEKVVMGGGALVLPIVHDVTEVSMNTLRLEIRRAREQSLISKDRMRVTSSRNTCVKATPGAVINAAQTLGSDMQPDQLRSTRGRIVDAAASSPPRSMEQMLKRAVLACRAARGRDLPRLPGAGVRLATNLTRQAESSASNARR
jgi:hypothetical protein